MVGYVAMISPENLRASALGFCSAITFVLGNNYYTNQGPLFLEFKSKLTSEQFLLNWGINDFNSVYRVLRTLAF